MNRQYAGIFDCYTYVPCGQGQNAFKSGLGRDEIADDRQRPADANQGAYQGNRDKQQHDDFDVPMNSPIIAATKEDRTISASIRPKFCQES